MQKEDTDKRNLNMSKKKKHHKGSRKTVHPIRGQRTQRAAEIPPLAIDLSQQLTGLTPDQLKDRLERAFLGAIALRNEPEFQDFYFEANHVLEATARHVERYKARFEALGNDNMDAARQLYDEMRIDIIADLVTPAVRRDLQERADRCLARLRRGRDADKLEMALYAHGLLTGMDRTLPLGLCGLFTSIYEDSRKRAIQTYEVEEALLDKITGWLPQKGKPDMEQLLTLAQRPEVAAEFAQILEIHPELRSSLEKDIDQVNKEVGQAIQRGELLTGFFTDEEILLTYADLFSTLEDTLRRGKTPDREIVGRKYMELMLRNVPKMITPERSQQFRQRLEATAHEMASSNNRERQEMGAKLSLAATTLDAWELGRHPLFYDAYLHQAEQIQKQGLASDASAEQSALFQQLLTERKARKT